LSASWAWLGGAIAAEVIATSFMRQTEGFTKPGPSVVTATGYAIAFWCLSHALRDIPTGIAYAVWSGIGIVAIAAIAWVFQGQRLDAPAMIGMALIVAGVLVMNLFSRAAAH
jgi:small multidrug resistance pump